LNFRPSRNYIIPFTYRREDHVPVKKEHSEIWTWHQETGGLGSQRTKNPPVKKETKGALRNECAFCFWVLKKEV